MLGWVLLVVAVLVLLLLSWWSSRSPDKGPEGDLARKFRDSGGGMGI